MLDEARIEGGGQRGQRARERREEAQQSLGVSVEPRHESGVGCKLCLLQVTAHLLEHEQVVLQQLRDRKLEWKLGVEVPSKWRGGGEKGGRLFVRRRDLAPVRLRIVDSIASRQIKFP